MSDDGVGATKIQKQRSIRFLKDFNKKDHTMKFARSLIAAALLALALIPAAHASQGSGCLPTTGVFNGLQENTYINAANAAFISMNSGASAPATDCSSVAVKGQSWLNTTINSVNLYDGLNWLYFGVMDTTNHVWKPVVGGGIETLASASTTDVCSVPGSVVNISGNATIASLGSTCTPGSFKMLVFTGAPTLTYSSALTFQGHLSITASTGDTALAFYLGSGNWQLNYNQASGQAMVNPTVEIGTVQMTTAMALPSNGKYVFGAGQALSRAAYPDYLATVTRSQNVVRSSGSPTLTGVADTSGMGAGMPIEGTGIQAATTIVSVTANSITMSQNAASSGTNTATVFSTGYGASGSTSTVGVPDCRGRAIAGRDDMNGTPANRLTAPYFGSAATALNAAGGSESRTLVMANLPPYTPSGTITNGAIAVSQSPTTAYVGTSAATLQGGATTGAAINPTSLSITATQSQSTFTGTSQGGTSAPLTTASPTVIANCIVRVLAMNFPIPLPINDGGIQYAIGERRAA